MSTAECTHRWEMTNIRFGFVAFEKCYHCDGLRTFFSLEETPFLGEKYREGDHFWSRVENAQSFQFDLHCSACGHVERFDELMGLLHCTGCMEECQVDVLRRKHEAQRTWIVVAFGFLPDAHTPPRPIPPGKLEILSDYFNQRRHASRARVAVLPFTLIPNLSLCRGDFLHDVGMLSQEAPGERQPLF
jgi:hypothetical protein